MQNEGKKHRNRSLNKNIDYFQDEKNCMNCLSNNNNWKQLEMAITIKNRKTIIKLKK